MKKITLLILTITLLFPAFMSAQTASDSVALANADWNWVRLGKGAKAGYALVPMFGAKMSISIIFTHVALIHVKEDFMSITSCFSIS